MSAHIGTHSTQSLIALNRFITGQGQMVAYIDDFRLMMVLTLLTFPFLLIFRRTKS
jgi:DHA2 family multidrug resistance protein